MTSEPLFRSETALVTGCGNNIGRAIALALADAGASIIATDINAETGSRLAADIEAKGGSAAFFAADLSTFEAPREVLATLGARLDAVSIFVHSASPRRLEVQTAGTVAEAEWDAMVNTNVRSGFFIARALGLRMQAAGTRGRMLFITSLHAESPRNLPHYSASKAGQTMVVKELARFFGTAGIRVNAIAPGAIGGGGFQTDSTAMAARIAMGRMGTAADIAGAAVALLSDKYCGYVTGTTLVVDGGLALHNWIAPASAS